MSERTSEFTRISVLTADLFEFYFRKRLPDTKFSKSGANIKLLCPFHSELTPSFTIHPQKAIWHCFGCGAGGDVIAFEMRISSCDEQTACQNIAEIVMPAIFPPYSARGSEERI
jgi:hypothetical protein